MNINDGLNKYKDTDYYDWALKLEEQGQNILHLIMQHKTNPPEYALKQVRLFLQDVEKWKAGCLQQRIGNAIQNSDTQIWNAIYDAIQSSNDIGTLQAIMQLKGFGSVRDTESGQRRAKVATSVLRFLWPDKWGVVDWRIAAMLGFLGNNNWDVDNAISQAIQHDASDYRDAFFIIDEHGAIAYTNQYREICNQYSTILPRPADVDMAVFGLSLLAWPMS